MAPCLHLAAEAEAGGIARPAMAPRAEVNPGRIRQARRHIQMARAMLAEPGATTGMAAPAGAGRAVRELTE